MQSFCIGTWWVYIVSVELFILTVCIFVEFHSHCFHALIDFSNCFLIRSPQKCVSCFPLRFNIICRIYPQFYTNNSPFISFPILTVTKTFGFLIRFFSILEYESFILFRHQSHVKFSFFPFNVFCYDCLYWSLFCQNFLTYWFIFYQLLFVNIFWSCHSIYKAFSILYLHLLFLFLFFALVPIQLMGNLLGILQKFL